MVQELGQRGAPVEPVGSGPEGGAEVTRGLLQGGVDARGIEVTGVSPARVTLLTPPYRSRSLPQECLGQGTCASGILRHCGPRCVSVPGANVHHPQPASQLYLPSRICPIAPRPSFHPVARPSPSTSRVSSAVIPSCTPSLDPHSQHFVSPLVIQHPNR